MATTNNDVTVVEIRNPFTHEATSSTKMYTDFEVCIKTSNKAFIISQSCVRRRYSDFVWLRKWLMKNNANYISKKLAKLPRKKFRNRFNEEFLKERMNGLETFLNSVLLHNVFLSDKALHLFLQSGMSVKQMNDFLLGKDGFHNTLFNDNEEHSPRPEHLPRDEHSPRVGNVKPTRPIPDSVESVSSVSSLTESFEKVDTDDLGSSKSNNDEGKS